MRWRLTLMMVAMRCDLLSAWAATPLAAPMAALAAAPSCSRVGAGVLCRAERSSSRRAGDAVSTAAVAAPSLDMTPVRLSPWVALRGAFRSSSFGEFMSYVRREQGDAVLLDLWPVLPPTYVLMGKEANRGVLSELDPSLEQILQELINLLPISARVPSEVDVDLQRKVAQLFSNSAVVNERLPSFTRIAHTMRERWVSGAAASGAAAGAAAGQQRADDDGLEVFLELSEYVLRADLEVLYGRAFTEAHAPRLVRKFGEWVQNIANGQLVGFFDDLGELLREAIAERRAEPERYADERSVLQVYLESGALERHDDDAVVGLLSMTLMAAVFNTQVSLAWILVHLYSDPELLERARAEVAACPDLGDYSKLQELPFLNSCIDEAVRLHTMLPGNTVLRKTRHEIQLGETTVPEGAVLWLYPNAVHLDETYFPQPTSFCPMRLLNGNLERMADDYELVTFGHGQKRCIGEKMARAMICAFLGATLPTVDADAPDTLPEDGFFDLIPASQLRLYNVRPRED